MRRRFGRLCIVAAAAIALLGAVGPVRAAPPDSGATDRAAIALSTLLPDPAPPKITNGRHYWTSNERRLDLFRPHVAGVGGAFIGVGADQNYILAAWARSNLIVVVDFDRDVVDLHRIYSLFFTEASTPQRFVQLWSEQHKDEAIALIQATHPGERLVKLFKRARRYVAERLTTVAAQMAEQSTTCVFDDPAHYAHVKKLFASGRVVAVRGDFTKPGVVRAIAQTLSDHGQTVGALYLSNIEMYFMYRDEFRTNMLAVPFDASSVVLRTLPARRTKFEYMIQAGLNFHAWMKVRKLRSVYALRGLKKGEKLVPYKKFIIDRVPKPSS